ncbi:hypothetical protein [Streptomyces sp. NPDC000878]
MATHESHQVLRTADILGPLHEEKHLYLRDPDGHRVEICTSDYYAGDPDHETYRWSLHDDRRRDFRGNAVIESWYKEPTPVLDLDSRQQPAVEAIPDESGVRVGADGLGPQPDCANPPPTPRTLDP